jgi:hypothetical protein
MFFKQMLDKLALASNWISLAWVSVIIAVPLAAACVHLFFNRMNRLAKGLVTHVELETEMQRLQAELQQLSARLIECETAPFNTTLAARPSKPVAVDLTSRGQILRLHRKGSSVHEIASGLQISPGEVELMIKVHGMSQSAGSVSIPSSPL